MEDGRGNVRFTTDGSKTVTSANVPTAFGVGSVTGGTASAFSWNAGSGYRQDGVSPTGLSTDYAFQKVGDRYYDPALMCFLTRDTELDQLPYTYCDGDPVNCVDPDGHKTKKHPGQPDNGTGNGGTGSGGTGSGGTGSGGTGSGGTGGGGTGSGGTGGTSGGDKKPPDHSITLDLNRGNLVGGSYAYKGFSFTYKKEPGKGSEATLKYQW